ncbi:hypothetical protein B0H19DRAFT_1264485 [Mycena capillaripes]|nr:hypothetical protein B0H19DRAFT_1264485 [Mycena capillaripes]
MEILPPRLAILTWRGEVARTEDQLEREKRLGLYAQWPEFWIYDTDNIIDDALSKFMEWRMRVHLRTDLMEKTEQRFQSHGLWLAALDQEIEDVAALEAGLAGWRGDLISQCEQPPVTLSLIPQTERRHRESKIVSLLTVLTTLWKSQISRHRQDNWVQDDEYLEREITCTLTQERKLVDKLSLWTIIRRWKEERKPKAFSAALDSSHQAETKASAATARTTTPGEEVQNRITSKSSKSHRNARPNVLLINTATTPRQEIQNRWNRIAREAGSAKIAFINEIDDEELPPNIGVLFQYLERSYLFEAGLNPKISPLVGCRCKGACAASSCHGQSSVPAYNQAGRVNSNVSAIFECNDKCSCPPKCTNRIAQGPRQFGIQIFKTEKCGWGVRVKFDVRKGTVMGIYTGLLIRREDAENLRHNDPRWSYCFSLDAMETTDDENEEPPENSYSVDAFGCGNWTRFINHSCNPNLRVIPVVYDTMPEDNLPYLAFVAQRDIDAYSELSFDYSPTRQLEFEEKKFREKGKAKRNRAKKETRCICGAPNCRGWL